MFKFLSSLVSALVLTASTAFAGPNFPKETIVIIGEIGRSTIEVPAQILAASANGTRDVHLFLNSPGGSVVLGNMIVQAIETVKVRGSKVICGTGVLAASMGFSILTACNTRYSLPSARLLFHPPRVGLGMGGVITPRDATFLADDLARTDREVQLYLMLNMPVPSAEWFNFHYSKETLWQATSLNAEVGGKFLTIVGDMQGIPDDKLLTFINPSNMFGEMGEHPFTEYIIRRLSGGGK